LYVLLLQCILGSNDHDAWIKIVLVICGAATILRTGFKELYETL
jgi:hypothetical protein